MSEQQPVQEQQEEQKTATICPCCGKPTLSYPVQHVPDMIMDQYMACMMSGTPFTHKYDMYDGRISVTVSQLSEDDRVVVLDILSKLDAARDGGVEVVGVDYDTLKGLARSLISVVEIAIKAGSATKVFRPADRVRDVHRQMKEITPEKMPGWIRDAYRLLTSPSQVSAMPPVQLMAVIDTHAKLLGILMDAGFDQNFWKGIELA